MIEDGTVTDPNFDNTTITTADMAVDPRNASNISSGSVPLAQLGNIPAADLTGLDDDIALLGFKTAANGSLAKYNLLDQTVDAFEDASGVDASESTDEIRDSSGKYYSGAISVAGATAVFTATGAATWTAPAVVPSNGIEVLIVAGGAGGGRGYMGGGGGAGGIVHDTDYAIVANTVYDLSVGAGGAGSTSDSSQGGQGTDSVWNINAEGSGLAFTASGGGGGASQDTPQGVAGGCGGGSGDNNQGGTPAASTQADFPGATSYGNVGGRATGTGADASAAGGGAGSAGFPSTSNHTGGMGGNGKQFASFMGYGSNRSIQGNTGAAATGAPQVTEYGTGDRRDSSIIGGESSGYITVSTDLNINTSAGTIQNFVDGSITGGTQFYPNGETSAGKYFRFDFGNETSGRPIITGAKWYQDATATQGVWKWQGSNDASSWTDIGASFTLGDGATNTSTPQTQTTMSANTTAYRYYQLYGISGSASNGASWCQIEFGGRGWFGGGGGGVTKLTFDVKVNVPGGIGGGGYGNRGGSGSGVAGGSSLANTGGGGAGGAHDIDNGGDGGSGFIGITYPAFDNYNDMTLVSTSTTAQAAPTKGDIVMTYTDGIGTASINSDITAEYSADNGSTYTSMTLASQGTTGGHTILTAHDVTRTSSSGTSMRYRIKTLNQSASKATRIHAVSLGWS